jgi:hypothetical protein
MFAEAVAASARDALRLGREVSSRGAHLREAMNWLCRAQDAVGGGGVSHGYALYRVGRRKRRGWLAAYPETTGYTIPTFLEYFRLTGDNDFRTRAIRMAQWETGVQMGSGAVSAGQVDQAPRPAIFNTGQVLFGWTAAYGETGDETFLSAAIRAADFLVREQGEDGAWHRGSPLTRPGFNTYDARTAWGLLQTAQVAHEPAYRAAAIRNLDFTLGQQNSGGWFAHCCLSDDERPLLHTIAYTVEALLAAGTELDAPPYVRAARAAADALMATQRPDGYLAGRFDSSWRPKARWSCPTGNAQMAIVWLRLFGLSGDVRYLDAARRANTYLCESQNLLTKSPGIRGGIKGSDPIWSEYGRFTYLNWATKFFADSLMLELNLDAGSRAE